MNDAFEELVHGLNDEQKAEFFKILHEAGISQHDRELAKLLRAFQLYKSFYEEIPKSARKASARIERIKDEIEKAADRVAGDAGHVNKSLDNICASVGEAADKASRRILNKIETTLEPLHNAVRKALPEQIADLEKAKKTFSDTVEAQVKATDKIRENIKVMGWSYHIAYAIVALAAVFSFWCYTSYRCEMRLYEKCAASEYNSDILYELAKSNRRLELTDNADKGTKLLSMKNAKGWNSTDKRGVIEFK